MDEVPARLPTIRRATDDDLPAVLALLGDAGLPIMGVAESFTRSVVAVAPDGHLLGCAGLERHGGVGLLRSVAVDPTQRGHGLGARLTAVVIAAARAEGLHTLYLLTETADRYFPRLGFVPIPREKADPALHASAEWREACPTSARLLRLTLAA